MRELKGFWKVIVSILSISLVVFQLYTAGFGVLPDIVQRSVHLGFVLTMCFLLTPPTKKSSKKDMPFYDVLLALISASSAVYLLLNYKQLLWDPLVWLGPVDIFMAVMTALLVLEASRRSVGLIFPGMALFFFIYAYYGPYFPGTWGHQRYSLNLIFQTFYHSTNGIWGTMVGISANMLAMFGIFSAILSISGGSQTFIKIGQNMTGKSIGGQGKVALIASGLFGMISGSAMANVVSTGTFTIPMMKKANYSNEWAAAISALGSTGGTIMPPMLGAGAFIMAQLLGINYLKIALAAAIPAVLYYVGAYVAVHFISVKDNIVGKNEKEKIDFKEYTIIFVPIILFLIFLFRGYTVVLAAFFATIGGFVATLGFSFKEDKNLSTVPKKVWSLFHEISVSSSKGIISMATLMAGSQLTITLISMTGFGVKLSDLIVGIGRGNLFLSLILSMIVCIILGMGLPATASYVLGAAILAPALKNLGLDMFVSHMFIFYFAAFSTITPPVCAAVYLSSGIAKSNWVKTAFLSCLIGLPAFIVPYTFVYNKSLLFMGSTFDIAISAATALLGVAAIGMGAAGFLKKPLSMVVRIILIISGVLLVVPDLLSSASGLAIFAAVYLMNSASKKKEMTMT